MNTDSKHCSPDTVHIVVKSTSESLEAGLAVETGVLYPKEWITTEAKTLVTNCLNCICFTKCS